MAETDVQTDSRPCRDRLALWSLMIFVIALTVRALHLWQIRTAPFFSLKMIDAESYDRWARSIADGDWIGREVFFQAPLYPYFLGTIYKLLGTDPMTIRVCQAVLGAFACVLIAQAGLRFLSKPVGIVAGMMLAVYAPAIFFDSLIQKAGLAMFFLCTVLWLLSLIDKGPRWWLWLLAGSTMGCLILTRENAMLFVPVIAVWLLVRFTEPGLRRLAWAAAFAVGLALLLMPVAVRNWHVGGEFHLTTSQFGPNFFVGNNARADGIYKPMLYGREGMQDAISDYRAEAELALGRSLAAGEVSSYYTNRALQYIRSQPGDWLKLIGRKFILMCNAVEIADTEDQYTYARWSLPLQIGGGVWHFGVLAPLAVLGAIVAWPKRRRLWLLLALLGMYAAGLMMFYVFGRYRFPLVPMLILFASAGVVGLAGFMRRASVLWIGAAVATTIAVAVVCNWPVIDRGKLIAMMYTNVGMVLVGDGRTHEAVVQFHEALQIEADFADAHYGMARALQAQNQREDAKRHYRLAIKSEPDHAYAHMHLAMMLQRSDEFEEALQHYNHAMRRLKRNATLYNSLGVVMRSRGQLEDAITYFRMGLKVEPGSAGSAFNLGDTLYKAGQTDEGSYYLRYAAQIDPQLLPILQQLGIELRNDQPPYDPGGR